MRMPYPPPNITDVTPEKVNIETVEIQLWQNYENCEIFFLQNK